MIKNIVFDMGKVLIYYESMRACRHFIENEEDQKAVCTAVFDSPEWILLDMGVISEEEGLKKMCARLPERLHEAAKLCFDNWEKYCMWKNKDMEALVREPLRLLQCVCPAAVLLQRGDPGCRMFRWTALFCRGEMLKTAERDV